MDALAVSDLKRWVLEMQIQRQKVCAVLREMWI